jgi:hypothetical protein
MVVFQPGAINELVLYGTGSALKGKIVVAADPKYRIAPSV